MEDKKKIILDCDPGSDDAIAIMLALFSEKLDVLGITVVNGNRILPKTLENTLRMKQFLGSSVPVYAGCVEPLVCNLIPERKPELPRVTKNDCHGDYLKLPEATIGAEPQHAVNYLVDTLMESDGDITLVTVGPLTNIAMAIRMEPRIVGKIKEIVSMGGGHIACNISSSAEFNYWADPEAAKIVMDTPVPKVILPLDATWKACISYDEAKELERIGTPAAKFAAELAKLRIEGLKVNDVSEHNFELRHTPGTVTEKVLYRYDTDRAPIHDALAVAYCIDPSVVTELVDCNVDIDISLGLCDGRMVADVHNTLKGSAPVTAKVALNADSGKFVQMLFEHLSKTVPVK